MTSGTGTCTSKVSWATDDSYVTDSKTQSTPATKIAPTVSLTAPATAAYQSSFTPTATTNDIGRASSRERGWISVIVGSFKENMTSGTGTCALTASWATDSNYNAATDHSSTHATK